MAGRTEGGLDFSWVRTAADLGEAISRLRAAHRTPPTLQLMAKWAGVSAPTTISNWMNGLLPSDEEKLDRLLAGLSAQPEEHARLRAAFRTLDAERRRQRRQSAPRRRAGTDEATGKHEDAPVSGGRRTRLWIASAAGAAAVVATIAVLVAGSGGPVDPGTPIVSRSSGMCLRPVEDGGEPTVRQYLCTADRTQWQVRGIDQSSSSTRLVRITEAASGHCLSGSDRLTGGPGGALVVVLRDCGGDDPAQVWRFEVAETMNGWTYGRLVNEDSGRCLDINRNSKDEGSSAVLWFCGDNSVNQRFSVVLDAPASRAPAGTPPSFRQTARPNGANTFLDPHRIVGRGARVAPSQQAEVLCKLYAPSAESVAPGYWYLVLDEPWRGRYFAPANSFLNGGPADGPGSIAVDNGVPDC
jgi:hypothetical protein